jgi:ABC-2 type transport system permease protein
MRDGLWGRLLPPINPLLLLELRSRMRSQRTYAILTTYMLVASGIVLLVYVIASAGGNSGVNDSSRVGTALFYLVIGLQLVLVSFVTPSLTATAISREYENSTFDLLRLTQLTARQIVFSKLISAFGFTVVLVFATLPMLSLALLLGGIELTQILSALLVIVLSALLFASLGIWVSSRVRTTASATVITYVITLGIVIGAAILTLVVLPSINNALYSASAIVKTNPILATIIQLLLVLLMSTSPISALVASEMNLAETGQILSMSINPLPGTTTPVILPAPFLMLAVLYLIVSIALVISTVKQINQMDRHG